MGVCCLTVASHGLARVMDIYRFTRRVTVCLRPSSYSSSRIESWLASSHGDWIPLSRHGRWGHGLCHVTVAGVTVAGVTVDIRLLRFVMELGFIFNIVLHSLRINITGIRAYHKPGPRPFSVL